MKMKEQMKDWAREIVKRYVEEFDSNPTIQGANFSWKTYSKTLGDMFIFNALVGGAFGTELSQEEQNEIREYALSYSESYLKFINKI